MALSQYYPKEWNTGAMWTSTNLTTTTSSSSLAWDLVTPPPTPRVKSSLEWLDAEIERVCANARLSVVPS